MNCRQFQEALFEYVEGSLPHEQRAQAERHVAGCAECNAAVRRERLAQARLSTGLAQIVEAMTLGNQGHAQLRKILENKGEAGQGSRARMFAELWVRVTAALGAAAAVAVIAIWVWRPRNSRPNAEETITSTAAIQVPRQMPTIQIRLPGIATSYTFQENGDFVVDMFVEQSTVVNVAANLGDLQ